MSFITSYTTIHYSNYCIQRNYLELMSSVSSFVTVPVLFNLFSCSLIRLYNFIVMFRAQTSVLFVVKGNTGYRKPGVYKITVSYCLNLKREQQFDQCIQLF